MEVIRVDSHFNGMTQGEFELSDNTDCRIVCLTTREVTILRKALTPFYWHTRYGDYINPGMFQVKDNTQFIEALEELEVSLMATCFDEAFVTLAAGMVEAADRIAIAIGNGSDNNCCSITNVISESNGGINGTLPDGTVTYGDNPYSTTPVTLPDGYSDVNEYNAQKCAIANGLADGIIQALRLLGGITTLSGIGLAVLAIISLLGIITIPEVAIPTLITMTAIVWNAGPALIMTANYLENDRANFVCIIYHGNTEAIIIEHLAEYFDIVIAAIEVETGVGLALKSLLMILANEGNIGKLFSAMAGYKYPDADCSYCICEFDVPLGTVLDVTDNVYTIQSVLSEGPTFDYQAIDITTCVDGIPMELLTQSGRAPSENPNDDDVYIASGGTVLYTSDTDTFDRFEAVTRYVMVGLPTAQFTITIKIEQ